jgi:hypothetical protein
MPAVSVKASAAMITATFDEAMNASSLTNNPGVFKLMKKGSKKPLAIQPITYDASTMTVTVTPVKKLKKGTYTVTLMGGANGAKDLVGNTLDVPSKVWKFKAK